MGEFMIYLAQMTKDAVTQHGHERPGFQTWILLVIPSRVDGEGPRICNLKGLLAQEGSNLWCEILRRLRGSG
jgi:hypothetical protein